MKKLKWIWLLWTYAIVTWAGELFRRPHWWNGGRRENGYPVICEECDWIGRLRDAYHGYQDDGAGDVEPVSECPKCYHQL